MNFNNLPLHDAFIAAIHIGWDAARCDICVNIVGGGSHWLLFERFTKLEFSRVLD